jgi:hypothetical protein
MAQFYPFYFLFYELLLPIQDVGIARSFLTKSAIYHGLQPTSPPPRFYLIKNIEVRSIGLWRWYIEITIKIKNIIHRPAFYLKHNVSETGFCLCLRLQAEPTQLVPLPQRRRSVNLIEIDEHNISKLMEKSEGKGPLGRSRYTRACKYNIKMHLGELSWIDMDWIILAQDSDHWRTLVIHK